MLTDRQIKRVSDWCRFHGVSWFYRDGKDWLFLGDGISEWDVVGKIARAAAAEGDHIGFSIGRVPGGRGYIAHVWPEYTNCLRANSEARSDSPAEAAILAAHIHLEAQDNKP